MHFSNYILWTYCNILCPDIHYNYDHCLHWHKYVPWYANICTIIYQFDTKLLTSSMSWGMLGETSVLHKQEVGGYSGRHPCYVNKKCRAFNGSIEKRNTARFSDRVCRLFLSNGATHIYDSGMPTFFIGEPSIVLSWETGKFCIYWQPWCIGFTTDPLKSVA